MTRRPHRRWLAGFLLPALAAPAVAFEVRPSLTLSGLYSDNITLAPKGSEQDEYVGIVQPRIGISSAGTRYDFQLDYQLQAIFYGDQSDANEAFSIGRTSLRLDVVPETFTVTGNAEISQVVADPQGQVPLGNVPRAGNLQDQAIYRLTPEFRQDVFGNELLLQATFGQVRFGNNALATGNAVQFEDADFLELRNRFTSAERDRGLGWLLRHEYSEYDYTVVRFERQLADLALNWQFANGWAPFVAGGVESDFADPTQSKMDVGTWQAGVRFADGNSQYEVSLGERSFGSNLRILLERTLPGSPESRIRASYTENPTVVEQLAALQIPSDIVVPGPGESANLPPQLFAPGTGAAFIQRQGDLSLFYRRDRIGVNVTLFAQRNEFIPVPGSGNATAQENEQYGLSLGTTYQLGQRLGFFADLQFADRRFSDAVAPDPVTGSTDLNDTFVNARTGVNYSLGQQTRLSLSVATQRRYDVEPTAGGASFEFTENQVQVLLTRDFF